MTKKKWFKVILIIIFLSGIFSTSVFATTGIDELKTGMKQVWKVDTAEGSHTQHVMNAVIKIIQIAGSGIALIVVIMLGIKYMLASPGEKADYKKTAVPIVIGCVLLFAASNIAGIIADVGDKFNG